MELEKVFARLRTRKSPYNTITQEEIAELTTAIEANGIKAVRKAIKEEIGNCDVIVFLLIEQKYSFRKYCKQVYFNEELVYCSQYLIHYFWEYNLIEKPRLNNTLVFITQDHEEPIYPDNRGSLYPRLHWIHAGNECSTCGTLWIQSYQQTHCPQCAIQFKIRSYSHQVQNELGFEPKKPAKYYPAPRYGIELEYEKVTVGDVFTHLSGHALPKSDGTISNGVEVVTRPACIATHKEKLAPFYSNVKVKRYPNTGMHVHIEREGLSEYQIGFISQFLNDPKLQAQNEIVAGREYKNNTYCRPDPTRKLTSGLSYNFEVRKLEREVTRKYSPVNTAKLTTVEIRIFSSPESAEECFAKLDFVSALVQYSSPYSMHVKSLKDKFSWDTFKQFILMHKKEFKDFNSYYLKTGKL